MRLLLDDLVVAHEAREDRQARRRPRRSSRRGAPRRSRGRRWRRMPPASPCRPGRSLQQLVELPGVAVDDQHVAIAVRARPRPRWGVGRQRVGARVRLVGVLERHRDAGLIGGDLDVGDAESARPPTPCRSRRAAHDPRRCSRSGQPSAGGGSGAWSTGVFQGLSAAKTRLPLREAPGPSAGVPPGMGGRVVGRAGVLWEVPGAADGAGNWVVAGAAAAGAGVAAGPGAVQPTSRQQAPRAGADRRARGWVFKGRVLQGQAR